MTADTAAASSGTPSADEPPRTGQHAILRVVTAVVVGNIVVELGIMTVLVPNLPPMSELGRGLVDTAVLVVVMLPLLWFFIAKHLLAETSRFAVIAETAPDIVAIFEPGGRVVSLNRKARELVGIRSNDRPPDSILRLFSAATARTLRDSAIPAALGTGCWEGDLAMVSAEGRAISTHVMVRRYPGPTFGRSLLWLRAVDLSAYNAVERMKDEFVSTVSHELLTPLASIRGSLGLIEGGAMGDVAPKVMEMVRIADSNADRLVMLIKDVLDVQQMRAGKLVLRREPVLLTSAVIAALAQVEVRATQAGIRIVTDFREPAPTVLADHERIVQLTANILGNALKFSPRGSTVTVRVASDEVDPVAVVSVTDEGPGIPPGHIETIFERLVQLDSSATRGHGGAGLGLAIARDIAEMHAGTLEASSPPGGGTTLTFTMPLFDGSRTATGPDAEGGGESDALSGERPGP